MAKRSQHKKDPAETSCMPFSRYHTDYGVEQFTDLLGLIKNDPQARAELEDTSDKMSGKPVMLLPAHLTGYAMDCAFEFFCDHENPVNGELKVSQKSYGAKEVIKAGYTLAPDPKNKPGDDSFVIDMGAFYLAV